jgi:hypothetical protein
MAPAIAAFALPCAADAAQRNPEIKSRISIRATEVGWAEHAKPNKWNKVKYPGFSFWHNTKNVSRGDAENKSNLLKLLKGT